MYQWKQDKIKVFLFNFLKKMTASFADLQRHKTTHDLNVANATSGKIGKWSCSITRKRFSL